MVKKGKILRIYDDEVVFENFETGSCLRFSSLKEGGHKTKKITACDRSQLPEFTGPCQMLPFEAIFGVYDLLSGPYVALLTDSEMHVSEGTINIRKAKKILVYPLFRYGRPLSEIRQRDENQYLQLLHLAFEQHTFYYSTTFDITLNQQMASLLFKRGINDPMWMRADKRFFWNYDVITDLISCEAHEWIVPFMSAYIEARTECEIEADKFSLILISRRSRYRQGCRFIKRGIDNDGNCANFVESEQITVFPDGKINAFIQIRGSIPLKWSSPVLLKYEPHVYIDENKSQSYDCTYKHITSLIENYTDGGSSSSSNSGNLCDFIFINLIDNKKDQGKLGNAFKEVIDTLKSHFKHNLNYIWFDYHHECKQKGKEKNLVKLISKIDHYFKTQRYFSKLGNGTIISTQQGVFRTNCMDNLDRTNVVQSIIARRSLFLQLNKNKSFLDNLLYSIDSPYKNFEKLFKTLWVNNADAMSMGYAGTGALKTDIVRKGKRTIKGMWNDGVNSLMRYYINNFTDGMKQDSIDLLLGKFKPDPLNPSPFISRHHQETIGDHITKAMVFVMTFFSFLLMLTSLFETQLSYYFSKFFLNSAQSISLICSSTTFLSYFDMILQNIPWYTPQLKNDYCTSLINLLSGTTSVPMTPMQYHILLLSRNICISIVLTVLIVLYISYRVIKKGSCIGECIAVHPQLLPEPIILLSEKSSSKDSKKA